MRLKFLNTQYQILTFIVSEIPREQTSLILSSQICFSTHMRQITPHSYGYKALSEKGLTSLGSCLFTKVLNDDFHGHLRTCKVSYAFAKAIFPRSLCSN